MKIVEHLKYSWAGGWMNKRAIKSMGGIGRYDTDSQF